MNKTFIIAEAGANHDKDFNQALKLVNVAISAGASAVKFQTYSSETLYSRFTPDFAGHQNIPDLIKSIEMPRFWQKDLKSYCDDHGIEFMSTPFDERAVDELYQIGVTRFKIAGFEASDPRFVKHVASTKRPLIISAGIGIDIKKVHDILDWILDANSTPNVTFLHCNNAYPTPFEDINLGQLKLLQKEQFKTSVKFGLSDHTEGILIPPVAVSLGASTIEKHYTLDRKLKGPDHSFAIEPDELHQMVRNIRRVETSLGVKEGKYTESEEHHKMARRSVIAKKTIDKGENVSYNNITTKRPLFADAVPASEFYSIIDRVVKVNIEEDQPIRWSDLAE